MATPPFGKILGVVSGMCLETRVSNLKSVALTALELLAFNSHDRPLRSAHTHTQTNRQTHTHIERTHYLRHSLRSLGGDNNVKCRRQTYLYINYIAHSRKKTSNALNTLVLRK